MLIKLLLVFVMTSISCNNKAEYPSVALHGRWVLDSTSGKGGKMISGGPREHTEFTLMSNYSFNFKWSDVDVSGEFNGAYQFNASTEKSPAMLILSTEPKQFKDSFVHRDTLIILELTDSTLKTKERESYTTPDSILIVHSRVNVYRKKTP